MVYRNVLAQIGRYGWRLHDKRAVAEGGEAGHRAFELTAKWVEAENEEEEAHDEVPEGQDARSVRL